LTIYSQSDKLIVEKEIIVKYGLFLVLNPPLQNELQDSFMSEHPIFTQVKRGQIVTQHLYGYTGSILERKEEFKRNLNASMDSWCVLFLNGMTLYEDSETLVELRDQLHQKEKDYHLRVVLCRCCWQSIIWSANNKKIKPMNPTAEEFLVQDPRVRIQEVLSRYGLGGTELWGQYPYNHSWVPNERMYTEGVDRAIYSSNLLPYCWHGARAIERTFLDTGDMQGALENHCALLDRISPSVVKKYHLSA
jgi:hypothetical protein